jgi:hypothetical protein
VNVLLAPDALATADTVAAALASPAAVLPGGYSDDGRRWPQSLAGGAAGIALLHVERARTGHGAWDTAHTWLAEAATGKVSAAPNAGLFFGAPALAFVLHLAHTGTGRYQRALAALDDAVISVTLSALDRAHARMNRAERPPLREFDLIRGLAGLSAYHLAARPEHPVTRSALACLARLTEPLPGCPDTLPPWWAGTSPSGEPSDGFPGGHGNFGMSHGISSVLAILSIGIMRGIAVAGAHDAAYRICAWTDQWLHGAPRSPWWPGVVTVAQSAAGCVDPGLRPRPSWCYGVAGTARAQQLAGLALGDPGRCRTAEIAMLAVLRDATEIARLDGTGLCHGTAGLLQSAWRMSRDCAGSEISAELPGLASRLRSQRAGNGDGNPELLDGAAGAALALHTAGAGLASGPCWDAFLALA